MKEKDPCPKSEKPSKQAIIRMESLGRITYQETKKILNITDRQLRKYIKNKQLKPKTTLYSEGPFFDFAEIRKIFNEEKGVDFLPAQLVHALLPPELEELIDDENSQLLSLHDILIKYGFKKKVIQQWIKEEKIKPYKKNGWIYIKKSDIEEYFRENMNTEKQKAFVAIIEETKTIEEKMSLAVHRMKTLYTNALRRLSVEVRDIKIVGKNIELAWFRVEKCREECIIGKKDLCSHYHTEMTEFGISPCIKQVTIKKDLMEDLKQRLLKEKIIITPTASAYIEIVTDAMVDYIFGRMLIQEMQGMPSENSEIRGSIKMIMALASSARQNREHIGEMLRQFEDYIKQIKPEKDKTPENPLQKFWEEKMNVGQED